MDNNESPSPAPSRNLHLGRRFLIGTPYTWLLLFFLIPFLIVFKISLSTTEIASPPYSPTFSLHEGLSNFTTGLSQLGIDSYRLLIDGIYFNFAYFAYFVLILLAAFVVFTGLRALFTNYIAKNDFSFKSTFVSNLVYALLISVIVQKIIWTHGSEIVLFGFKFEDNLYVASYISSLKIAGISTFFTLLIGYPIAYGMSKAPDHWRTTLLMLVILPFWTSFLVRVYAWIGFLKNDGFLNQFLMYIGVIHDPLVILNTNLAVYIGIVYSYLPFMILPLYSSLEKMDYSLIEAAQDMGCTPFKSFWLVTFPLSKAGVIAGCFLVFIPAVGEFVIPDLLGGSNTLMIGKTLWVEFFYNRDWPVASAVATVLLLLLLIPIVIFQRQQDKQLDE